MTEALTMDIQEVMRRLPHRYPFLLVDRVLECIAGQSIRAIKNVTINEPFFPGHFPHRPVLPGVIILEALAQTAGVTEQVEFLLRDLFTADIGEATVVTLYLLDVLNERLRPTLLRDLLPGTRIISHAFRMGDWEPEQTTRVDGRMVYGWTVPAPAVREP